MGYDFQDSKVLTSILWRHNHMKFSNGLETTTVYTLRIYAAMNGLFGGAKTDFVPGRGKP